MEMIETGFGVVRVRRLGDYRPGLVALHGFTQHGGMFEEVASLLPGGLLAVDLPGHGTTEVEPVSFAGAVGSIAEVLAGFEDPVSLLGYSQGGRVALAIALEKPGLVDRLVLVSASPGIADPRSRAARKASDDELAGRLEEIGVAAFVDEWLALDMFAGLHRRSSAWIEGDRALRCENPAAGLAAALREMGQGSQPYVGPRLNELKMPVLLLAGEHDPKYTDLARGMAAALPQATCEIVPGAGHAVIGERPKLVARLIAEWTGSR